MKQFKRTLSAILALVMLLGMVYWAPAVQAAASDYISASYVSHLSIQTTQTTTLNLYPSNVSGSAKYSIPADTSLTATALHESTDGSYWYEVSYYELTMYVPATSVQKVDHLTGDVTIADVSSPASLAYGVSFTIEGTVTSTKNKLDKVTVSMYNGTDLTRVPALSVSDSASGNTYSLKGSAIDSGMTFGSLAAGVYTYTVTAQALSYYIDQSGALATSTQNVLLEQQQCVITDWQNPNDALAFGIDVSVWNGSITWSSVASEVDYVILRIGFAETLDNRFLEYAQGCEDNDIPYGVYLYSYAESESEAIGEAEFVIDTLNTYGFSPELPIWFDMEDSVHTALSSTVKNQVVQGFCDTIKDAGYQPGLYTFISWFNSYFTASYYDTLPKWVAQIDGFSSNGTSTFNDGTWMWQYSWEGSISGISGDVDCNYYYAEVPGRWTSDTSYLTKCTKYPTNVDITTTATANMRQYPSSSYTLLESLSAGTTVHATAVYKNASGEYWYQVEKDGRSGYLHSNYVTVTSYRYDDLAAIEPTMSDLSVGASYSIQGELISQHNEMYKVYAKVYSGEDVLASPVISGSATVNGKSYDLLNSTVDYGIAFGSLSTGYYTYEISADVKSYYVSNGTLTSKTENVVLWKAAFKVGSPTITVPADPACDHTLVTDAAKAATCTTTGLTEGQHCSKCGTVTVAQTVIPVTDHIYSVSISSAGSCTEYAVYRFTCTGCSDSFEMSADELSDWTALPKLADSSLFQAKTQYRYADYETLTSYEPSLAGYTVKSTAWVQSGTGTVEYVKNWLSNWNNVESDFPTDHDLYIQYNNLSNKVTDTSSTVTESDTTMIKVDSDEHTGYLWYHWYSPTLGYSRFEYYTAWNCTVFHAYYGTNAPENYTYESSEGSYHAGCQTCSNDMVWYIPVYTQKYTTYQKQFTYERWSDWSAWSDTAVTASSTRKVEAQTVYRLENVSTGQSHTVVTDPYKAPTCTQTGLTAGSHCSACGTVIVAQKTIPTTSHNFVSATCTTAAYCTGCGSTAGEPLGHKHTYVFNKLPTTSSYGSVTLSCSACSSVTLATMPYLTDPSYSYTVTEAASCTTVGTGQYTWNSTRYGPLLFDVEIAATGHSYADGVCQTCGYTCSHTGMTGTCTDCGMTLLNPTLQPTNFSLSFEGEVLYNIYFTATDLDGVSVDDMGLLTWTTPPSNGTIDNAHKVMPGAQFNGSKYMVQTDGIAAKYLGDTIYFRVYAKLADGSYVYSNMYSVNAKSYALGRINNSTDPYMRALCVALLNYGAEAQKFFSYKAYDLMNASLTAEQQALVSAYSETMVDPVVAATDDKVGNLIINKAGFTALKPTVSFDGAFSINYYFTTSQVPDNGMILYYWNAEDYAAADFLRPSNITGSVVMEPTGGTNEYWAEVSGIAAKELDQTIYVTAIYTAGGTTYTTGVIAYHVGRYCESTAANASSAMQPLAAATATYGYYAKEYFKNLNG